MSRTIPVPIRRELRKEVKFRCPLCGSPFLTYHHFDPTWSEMERRGTEDIVHDPQGIIALCRKHHDIADGGAFTKAQLHSLKKGEGWIEPQGFRINWFRENLLIHSGNFHINAHSFLRIDNREVVGFTRDSENNLLLNVEINDKDDNPVVKIVENDWLEVGGNEVNDDEEFLPHGHKFNIRHPDFSLSIEYKSCDKAMLPIFLWGNSPIAEYAFTLENLQQHFTKLSDNDERIVVCRLMLELNHPIKIKINRDTSQVGGLRITNSIFVGTRSVYNYFSDDGKLRIGV